MTGLGSSITGVLRSAAIALMCIGAADVVAGNNARAQSSAPATAVILATPSADGAESRKEYSEKVNPLGKEAGVEIINGVRINEPLVGELSYKAVFLLGFSSEKAAKDFFSSEEYQALIPLRDAGYEHCDVLIGQ